MGRDAPLSLVSFVLSIVLVSLMVIFTSGCVSLTNAYVPETVLTGGWYENTSLRDTGSQSFGLERWASTTYQIDGEYPAFLIVTTMKTLMLMDEQQLQGKLRETLNATLNEGILINESTLVTGERILKNAHKTLYVTYNGVDQSTEPPEQVKIIGEVWNCAVSGTSIICIGLAYTTHTQGNSSVVQLENWGKIVMDDAGSIEGFRGETGLLYHVTCE